MISLDPRFLVLPERRDLMTNLFRVQLLPHLHLWRWHGKAVQVKPDGSTAVFIEGGWRPFNRWNLVRHGIAMSFFQFNGNFPNLVSPDEYIASFNFCYPIHGGERLAGPSFMVGKRDSRSSLYWKGATRVRRSQSWHRPRSHSRGDGACGFVSNGAIIR